VKQIGFEPGVTESEGAMDGDCGESTEAEVTGAGKGESEIEKLVRSGRRDNRE